SYNYLNQIINIEVFINNIKFLKIYTKVMEI
ncbi:MAG: hypothetical protein K0S93_420, partial [Nitrososphaeraceae archaeon]|nr:hypothetical protein [Nitrososphaeraceae archaeon]